MLVVSSKYSIFELVKKNLEFEAYEEADSSSGLIVEIPNFAYEYMDFLHKVDMEKRE